MKRKQKIQAHSVVDLTPLDMATEQPVRRAANHLSRCLTDLLADLEIYLDKPTAKDRVWLDITIRKAREAQQEYLRTA